MGVDTDKRKFAVFYFFEQQFFPPLKSVSILNHTCSGVYQAAREVGVAKLVLPNYYGVLVLKLPFCSILKITLKIRLLTKCQVFSMILAKLRCNIKFHDFSEISIRHIRKHIREF